MEGFFDYEGGPPPPPKDEFAEIIESEDFYALNILTLKSLAKEKGIKGADRMKKAQLAEALKNL